MTVQTTDAPADERALPSNVNAEQCVLSAMLLSKGAIGDVADMLKPEDFYRPAHQIIYTAILGMYAKGEPVDPITLAAHLNGAGTLLKTGGHGYIFDLHRKASTAANADYYADIVRDRAVRRRLIEAGTRIANMGYATGADTAEILDAAGNEFNAAIATREDSQLAAVGDDFEEYIDHLEAVQRGDQAKGVLTGFTDLDSLTSGLHPGELVIIAARPAIGKSTLALDWARTCAIKHGRPVAFFSLEMSRNELRNRMISAQGRIALHHIRHKSGMTNEDWRRFAGVMPRVTAAPLFIDATPGQTVLSIKAKCRRLQQRHGLDLVVVDYLQLLESGLKRTESRQVEVSMMSRNLKLLAQELQVPVVVLAQLNRGPEQRADKKPVLSDLRESGAIEQDADVVILLHREDAYDKASARSGEADLIVAKHRHESTPTITVAFQGHYSRFVDMAADV